MDVGGCCTVCGTLLRRQAEQTNRRPVTFSCPLEEGQDKADTVPTSVSLLDLWRTPGLARSILVTATITSSCLVIVKIIIRSILVTNSKTNKLTPKCLCQVLYYLWFTIALVYFSLALNSHVLFPSTLHLNTAAAGALELPAYTLTLVALLYAGRNSFSCRTLSDPNDPPLNPQN